MESQWRDHKKKLVVKCSEKHLHREVQNKYYEVREVAEKAVWGKGKNLVFDGLYERLDIKEYEKGLLQLAKRRDWAK